MFIITIHSTDSMAHVFVEGNITSQIEYQWFFGDWVQNSYLYWVQIFGGCINKYNCSDDISCGR